MVVGIKKKDALDRARRIEMSDITGDLPIITPTDAELKESGTYHRARIELMRSKATEAQLQQRRYLDQIASDLKLAIIPTRGLSALKKETGYEWTNGWTKHEKRKRKTKVKPKPKIIPVVPIERIVIGEKKRSKRKITATILKSTGVGNPIIMKSLSKGKLVLPPSLVMPKGEIRRKPKRKRQRLHTARNGKTPRVLRKAIKNGHRVFSFSDDVWKVKSPKRRR